MEISLNLIIERYPDYIYITNSYKNGIGGFSILTGRAWRFKLPEYLKGKVSNNVLEYLVEIIAIWQGILNEEILPLNCIFSGTDSTTTVK